jgi:MFS family permease
VAGDQLARVALTVLVYARTGSALLSAVTFVASILPLFVGGIALGGLADRFPRRAVMISCDLLRCLLVLIMALPGIPVWPLVVLLVVVTMISAPFSAARSAVYPDVLKGERYVLGQTITQTTAQFGQVVGFAVGGAVVAFLGTHTSLLVDAATYAVSALIVSLWVRSRPVPVPGAGEPPGADGGTETGTATGFRYAVRIVCTTPALLVPMLFGWLAAFYNAPEGVVAPLAASVGGGASAVGIILAAQVLGETVGMALFGRLVPPGARRRWTGPLAIGACAVLILFALPRSLGVVLPVLLLSGLLGCYQIAAIQAFVRAVPPHIRGTAFGLAQGGMSLVQGVIMIAAGAAAEAFAPTTVIACVGVVGTVCAALVALRWARLPEESQPEA